MLVLGDSLKREMRVGERAKMTRVKMEKQHGKGIRFLITREEKKGEIWGVIDVTCLAHGQLGGFSILFIFSSFFSHFGLNKIIGLRIGSGLSNLAYYFISSIFHLFFAFFRHLFHTSKTK